MVADADALIVRTRTKCNSQLLKGSNVKVIASATIGFDHIDTSWLRISRYKVGERPRVQLGVGDAVYNKPHFFTLRRSTLLTFDRMTLGVVGVGNVGSKVVRAAKAIGMNVLQNDPPRQTT